MSSVDLGGALYSHLAEDPDLCELVEMFVDEMDGRVRTLQTVRASEDLEQLCRTAHQLKGAAGSYGFPQLTSYAARLEHVAREKADWGEIDLALEDLITQCRRCRAGLPGDD